MNFLKGGIFVLRNDVLVLNWDNFASQGTFGNN